MTAGRVCYVVNAVDGGSIPADVADAVTATTPFDVELLAWFDAEPVPGLSVPVRSLDAPDTALGADRDTLRALWRALGEYDLVHVHHNHSGLFGTLAAVSRGMPVVSTEHNDHRGFTREGRLVNGLTNPLADRVTCVSAAVWDSFEPWERFLLDAGCVEVVHNGVDLRRIDRATEDGGDLRVDPDPEAFVVGGGGSLTDQKGFDTLVRAVAAASDRTDRPVELVLSGRGPLRADLERLAADLGIEERVHFLGFLEARDDVYRVMAAADAWAVPSRWEGFCVAVTEAMAAGTPCVLSELEVFRELYDGAALFHPVDDHGALADRLVTLAEGGAGDGPDADRRADLAARARELVEERYTLDVVAERYADVYRALC